MCGRHTRTLATDDAAAAAGSMDGCMLGAVVHAATHWTLKGGGVMERRAENVLDALARSGLRGHADAFCSARRKQRA